MSNRPKGYGLTSEIKNRMDAKYDVEIAAEIVAWIQAITGKGAADPSKEAVQEFLKDGHVLLDLIDAINPAGMPKKRNTSKMAFNCMERISQFLVRCEQYGVKKLNLFQTVDLYEGGNMSQVLITLHDLGSQCISKEFNGPTIGVKKSKENKREHDEETQRAGRNIIGLQMGSNQGSSQSGMTVYGLGRQINPN